MSEYQKITVGEIVRKAENDYNRGTTQISKYVSHSLSETLDRTSAYLNSKHITGETDSKGREKPFFNVSVAAANIWYRATDIDRKHIKIRATKKKDWFKSFLATVCLQDWMRREHFGITLNEWGRVLSRYGSAVLKFVENESGLHIQVIPWATLIVDAVDFDSNPKIEVIELTEAQLRQRIGTHGYDKEQVESLCSALKSRETLDKRKKDNKSDYIKLYEVHGMFPLGLKTGKEKDFNEFTQQVHVISFVGLKGGRKTEYKDFTLYSGEEEKDPYMITHLIKEDGRTLSIGAVEHLFESQWMVNHSMKAIKDSLDLASKNIFQTADPRFVGRNVLSDIENGDIFIHNLNQPVTQINSQALNIVGWQNFAVAFKDVGNEEAGISEAMLGAQPKAGTAWRQTEAMLQENYSLFELMTENKGNDLELMLTDRIIPFLKRKKLNHSKEISAILETNDLDKIDSTFLPKIAIKNFNKREANKILNEESPIPFDPEIELASVKDEFAKFGNQRFFKPSEISDTTWKELLKDVEWDLEIDITGEVKNVQESLATLSTALQTIVSPGYAQNKNAQMIVGKILELTGTISPLQLSPMETPVEGSAQVGGGASVKLPANKERNIT